MSGPHCGGCQGSGRVTLNDGTERDCVSCAPRYELACFPMAGDLLDGTEHAPPPAKPQATPAATQGRLF